jgi:multidrug resistance efflux pump
MPEVPNQAEAVRDLSRVLVEPNGPSSPSRSPSRLPKARQWSKRAKLLLALAILLVLVGGVAGAGYVMVAKPFRAVRTDLITHKIHYGRLELTIVERGQLESANNHDIVCRVKARAQGSQNSTTIKWIIDDGSRVLHNRPKEEARSIVAWDPKSSCYVEKPGKPDGLMPVLEVKDKETGETLYSDLLVDLDESGLIEQLKTEKITLDQAEANKVQAEESYNIQVSQNESDIKTAETTLQLATIDLEKYLKGDFPQALKDVEGRIKVAESDLEQQRDRAAWAQRMLKKGYYTVSQADSEQSKLQSLELSLAKVEEEKRVLIDKDYGLEKRTETAYRNSVEEAKRALARIKSQAHAKEVQSRADRDAKKSVYEQERTKYRDIEEEIKKCKLCAPIDGLVVYYVAEQTRWGVGRQALVAQGETVTENQKLMQIPDLTHMLVNAKVHEALVSRIHKGQQAVVRVDAMPNSRLRGHVETVANTPSQQDFFAADVKVYATKIFIDEEVEGLKPGMTAEVTITVADALDHVLTVPIEAIIGSAEMGATRQCFVVTPQGPEKRDIGVEMSNDREAAISSGLVEGDEVVINPKALVGDKVKTREPGELSKGNAPDDTNGKRKGGAGGKGRGNQVPGGPAPNGPKGAEGPGLKGKAGGPTASMPAGTQDQEKRRKEMVDRFRQATPEQRKTMLEQVPEEFRGRAKEALKAAGLQVKD